MTLRTLVTRTAVYLLLLWFAALPLVSFAQTCDPNKQLCNPLHFPSLEKFIEGVLQAIVMIALPIIVAFTVYAGFKYIFAQGKPGEISKAHENFLYLLIGTVLVLGAWVLATLIGGTVTQLLGN